MQPNKFLLKGIYGLEEVFAWRIPRWLFNAWSSLISERNDLSNSGPPFCLNFCSRGYMVWKKKPFEVAAMVPQHKDSAGCESTIPSLMPYKLSHCALQICRWFFEFEQFRKLTLQHSVFQTYTRPNLSILIGIIPHDSTLKHYFVEKYYFSICNVDKPNKYKKWTVIYSVYNWIASGLSSVTVASGFEGYLPGL